MNDYEFLENAIVPEEDGIMRKFTRIPAMRKVLFFCFLIPAALMTLIYFCLQVWPVGEHAVLVLDLNAQYVYYFEKLRNILVSGDSLLYSFERALGGEFMGIFAYYLSSPLSFIVALLPKTWMSEAIFILLVLKTGLCGFTFAYFLMKTRMARPVWMVTFSSMYALCAYVVVMQHNIMWMDNIILFPIILLGMDALIKEGRFRMYTGFLAVAIFSNFYIGYMTCLFIAVYFFIRYFTMAKEERNPGNIRFHFVKTLIRIIFYSLIAVMIAAIILLPIYYSLSFGKLDFSTPNYESKQMYDFLQLLTKTFFASYDTVRPAGMPFLYCGMLVLALLPLYFLSKKIPTSQKVGSFLVLAFLVASFNYNVLDIIWHGFQRPNWLNARFAYMFVFFAVLCAYDAFVNLKETGIRKLGMSCMAWGAVLIVIQTMDYSNVKDFMTIWAGLGILAVYAVVVPFALRDREIGDTRLYNNRELLLVTVVLLELTINGVIMLYALDADVTYTTRNSYRSSTDKYSEAVEVIEELDLTKYGENSLYRAEKTTHRKKNDNFAIDINGLSNSTSTLNAKSIEFLHNIGIAARSHWSLYHGGTPVTDSMLGIRYLMVDRSASDVIPDYIEENYELLTTTEENIEIYENPYSLGIAFAVDNELREYAAYDEKTEKELEENGMTTIAEQYPDAEEYKTPFEYINHILSNMVGREVEVFSKVEDWDKETQGVVRAFTTGHEGYKKDGTDTTAKLIYTFTTTEKVPIYVYFPSDYPRDVNMKLDGSDKGTFFDDATFCIRELGTLEKGTHELALYLKEDYVYISNGCNFFWYFHEDVFAEVMAELSEGTMTAYSETDDRITGTLTTAEGQNTVFTSIPYDEGWKVYVDGEETEIFCLLDTMLGFAVDNPGEHEIELLYRPDCVKYGLILSVSGIVIYALLFCLDVRKRRLSK
ncbi:MAG: YfhO family protein [Clostridia bacterium]|nr:YfhO family protein [Clostridia bacterium]